jgi:hypothetical protein
VPFRCLCYGWVAAHPSRRPIAQGRDARSVPSRATSGVVPFGVEKCRGGAAQGHGRIEHDPCPAPGGGAARPAAARRGRHRRDRTASRAAHPKARVPYRATRTPGRRRPPRARAGDPPGPPQAPSLLTLSASHTGSRLIAVPWAPQPRGRCPSRWHAASRPAARGCHVPGRSRCAHLRAPTPHGFRYAFAHGSQLWRGQRSTVPPHLRKEAHTGTSRFSTAISLAAAGTGSPRSRRLST